jgi:acetyl esterase/lipase
VVHGGCWLAQYDVEHIGLLADALAREGIATWSLEYRRVGNDGGGWPGTFVDVARGADFVRTLAKDYPLDASRVIAVGHSAGGHLALWLACRNRLPKKGELYMENPIKLQGVVALAAVPQLEDAHAAKVCGHVVDKLMGGSPQTVPKRFAEAAPAHMLPLGLPQVLINGAHDNTWSPYGEAYYETAKAAGDNIRLIVAPEAGHFELILPSSSTWPIVLDATLSMFKPKP